MMEVAPDYKDIGKRMRNIPMLIDLDERFRVMDRFDDYQQILSIATPPIERFADRTAAIELARIANDGMAELARRFPDRFPAFVASVPLNDAEAAADETHRAVGKLGARGIQLFTNALGRPIAAPEFLPLFEAMAAYDLPIWLHPFRGADFPDYLTEERSQYEIWWTFGWPYDTSAAMARLVFTGLFDRFPDIKIITHHMGAMIPFCAGRVGGGLDQLGSRSDDPEDAQALGGLRKRPIDYFKMFYGDTALFGAWHAMESGLAFFGADHVLFGTD
ncbi:MAG: amidohydrolase family protein, partial [Sphingomicrobium sp.]